MLTIPVICGFSSRRIRSVVYHCDLTSAPFAGRKQDLLFPSRNLPVKLRTGFGARIIAFARRRSLKKVRKDGKASETKTSQLIPSDKYEDSTEISLEVDDLLFTSGSQPFNNEQEAKGAKVSLPSASRNKVLQACIVTCGFILALGLVIRQVAHVAFLGGWPVVDPSTQVPFDFQVWHLELIIGLVLLISSCRYVLLKIWPNFSESAEASNQQVHVSLNNQEEWHCFKVLGSLQPLDYVVIAFLPGISEEILFRGALLPLFGTKWESALAVGVIFGALHMGSGRRYSFAIWATFVGFAYGMATILSTSLIVPMASHSLNNLVGGILWKYSSTSEKQQS